MNSQILEFLPVFVFLFSYFRSFPQVPLAGTVVYKLAGFQKFQKPEKGPNNLYTGLPKIGLICKPYNNLYTVLCLL